MKTQELNTDSHIFLYAKGWYKKRNVLADLKKIYAVRNGCEAEDISNNEVLTMLCELVFPFIKSSNQFHKFIGNLFRRKNCSKQKPFIFTVETTNLKKVFESLLSILELTKIKDNLGNILIKLDEPDYSILPKQEK